MDFENSDLSEREKMTPRFADSLKVDPQGVSEEFLEDLKSATRAHRTGARRTAPGPAVDSLPCSEDPGIFMDCCS